MTQTSASTTSIRQIHTNAPASCRVSNYQGNGKTLDCAISRFWISTSSPMVSTRPMGCCHKLEPARQLELSIRDETEQWVGSNALSLERRLKPWWLASGGYMVSTSRGDVNIGLGNVDPTQFSYLADPFFSRVELENQSHVLNLNSLFGPWKNWVSYAGVQGEWSRRKAAGTPSIYGNPSHLWTHRDRFQVEENLGLRHRLEEKRPLQ